MISRQQFAIITILFSQCLFCVPWVYAQSIAPTPSVTPTDAPTPTLTPAATPTMTPTPSLTPTPTSSGCIDVPPGSTVRIISAQSTGAHTILLSWSGAANPVTYYLLSYGLSSGQYIYGNPNLGPQGTNVYTVGGLATGTRYYFAIRAGNGCATGSFSNEVSAVAGAAPTATPTVTSANFSGNDLMQQDALPTDTPTDAPIPTAIPTVAPGRGSGITVAQMVMAGTILGVVLMIGVGVWNVALSRRRLR